MHGVRVCIFGAKIANVQTSAADMRVCMPARKEMHLISFLLLPVHSFVILSSAGPPAIVKNKSGNLG